MSEESGPYQIARIPPEESKNINERPWLDEYEQPWWISNDIRENSWKIRDIHPNSKPMTLNWEYPLFDPITREASLLTDPENVAFLECAQRVCILYRESQFSNVSMAKVQVELIKHLMATFAWLRLNFVTRVDQIELIHFKMFLKKAPWGWMHLWESENRLLTYIDELKRAGKKLPTYFDSTLESYRVNMRETLLQIGIDPTMTNSCGQHFSHFFWTEAEKINGHEQLKPNQIERIKGPMPEREPRGFSSVNRMISVWQFLYDVGHLMPEHCRSKVNPATEFTPGETHRVSKIARQTIKIAGIDDEEGMTETIPDTQGFHIVDAALRWVLIYSEDLLELRKQAIPLMVRAEKAQKEGQNTTMLRKRRRRYLEKMLRQYEPQNMDGSDPGVPWPLNDSATGRSNTKDGLSLQDATGAYLMVACAIVIAAFSARRKNEVMGIRAGAPTDEDPAPYAIHIDNNGDPWLWCWIEKTLQKWDRVPIPKVVVKAVEVLEALTDQTRTETSSRSLFEVPIITGGKAKWFDFLGAINQFSEYVGVPPLEDGSKWIFKPHQFRRFFSLLYMYRWNYAAQGKFEALSWHLRHLDLEMTKRYVEEINESDMLKAHRKNIAVDMMSDVLRGKRHAMGPGGKAMNDQLDAMFKEVIKNTEFIREKERPDIARKIAERLMAKLDIDMVPLLHGYCYAFKDAEGQGFRGNCVMGDKTATGPDLSIATAKVCLGCLHLWVEDSFKPYWEINAHKNREFSAKEGAPEPQVKIAMDNLAVFTKGLKLYFEDYDWVEYEQA